MRRDHVTDLERHLRCLLDGEVRIFDDEEIAAIMSAARLPDRRRAAAGVATRLLAAPVGGEIRLELARLFTAAIGAEVPTPPHGPIVEPYELACWTTVADATTMERPLSGPLAGPEAAP